VVSDAILLLDGDRILVAVPRAVVGDLRASLDHYLIMEDAEVAEGAFDVEIVHGPRSADVLAAMQKAGARGASLDFTGLGGAVVLVDPAARAAVDAARDAALAASGGLLGDEASGEALRIARRVPRFGVDFDGATYPQEAGLEKRAVSFNKGCYLGQEVVCMLELRGHVKRRLVGLKLGGAEVPAHGADVTDAGGESVGSVTSAAAVPGEGVLALAMVKRTKGEPGAALRVSGADAVVVAPAG
jgi:folate-binding protein YgfZ